MSTKPIYPQPTIRLSPRPPDPSEPNHKVKAGIEPNLDFGETSPHQEGIITEMYESPGKSYLEKLQELSDLVDSIKFIHKYLPKQRDIDKIMDIIKRKCLRNSHTINYQRDTSRLSEQFLFQRLICVSGPQ